jgi:hypothetical protein
VRAGRGDRRRRLEQLADVGGEPAQELTALVSVERAGDGVTRHLRDLDGTTARDAESAGQAKDQLLRADAAPRSEGLLNRRERLGCL